MFAQVRAPTVLERATETIWHVCMNESYVRGAYLAVGGSEASTSSAQADAQSGVHRDPEYQFIDWSPSRPCIQLLPSFSTPPAYPEPCMYVVVPQRLTVMVYRFMATTCFHGVLHTTYTKTPPAVYIKLVVYFGQYQLWVGAEGGLYAKNCSKRWISRRYIHTYILYIGATDAGCILERSARQTGILDVGRPPFRP